MSLSPYEWVYGVTQFSVAFLSVISIVIALLLMRIAWKHERLASWRYLLIALVLFAIEEILGGLVAFGIIAPTFWTHVIPSFIMGFMIIALLVELYSTQPSKRRRKR